MSKIEWDSDGERLYEVGVDRGVVYPYDKTAVGKGTKGSKYVHGYGWNGLTAVNESPSGAESSPIYADNIKYLNITSKEEYGASIEAYTYPDAFAECDGTLKVSGLRFHQQNRKTFGFSYRNIIGNDTEKEDYGYRINLIYGCIASPSEKSHATINENVEPGTMSWEVTTTPVPVDDIGEIKNIKAVASLDIKSVDYWDEQTKDYSAGFKELEKALYGVTASGKEGESGYIPEIVPWLPLPNDVYSILSGTMDASGNVING